MSAFDQPSRQLAGEGFEAAVARRHAARAEDGQLQRNHPASSRSEILRRLWMARRLAMIRRRFFHSQVSAENDVRSTVSTAPMVIRSRVSSNGALRSARYAPSFFSRSRNRLRTES